MVKKVRTEAELGEALKNNEESIEIEGDLAKKTFKIRATGKVAWAVCIGAIGVAIYSVVATVGTSSPVTATTAGFTAATATTILGGAVTYSAIAIGVAAGGVGALNKLRKYKQVSYENERLILRRK